MRIPYSVLAALAAVALGACETVAPTADETELGAASAAEMGAAPRREPCGEGPAYPFIESEGDPQMQAPPVTPDK